MRLRRQHVRCITHFSMMETKEKQSPVSKKTLVIHEDWVTVILGFGIIALFLSGIVFTSPSYSWSGGDEFVQKILTAENLFRIFLQFILVLTFSLIGAVFTNKRLEDTLKVFPLLYLASVVALILAGNSSVKTLNLEAVIFSLVIGLVVGNTVKLP